MKEMLQLATEQIRHAGTFLLPELTLSFYSDKEPILLAPPKRIQVEACRVLESVLEIRSGGKALLVALNPDDDLQERLANSEFSSLMVRICSEESFTEQLLEGALHKVWLYNAYAHKVFRSFLQAAVELPIEQHAGYRHVPNCPIQTRVYHGKPYANTEEDCRMCMFCIDMSERNVISCTGRQRLATLEDFKRSLQERQAIYDEFLQPDKVGLVAKGICPHCGSALMEKKGELGPFLGCGQYPFCHFTAKRQEDGSLSFNF